MQEDFKVSITGDISGLKKAVGDAEKELSNFASKSQSLKSAIAENIAISRGYDQAINELKKSFRSGAISQTQFKEALVRLKRDEKETAIETNKLKNELIDLNRAGAGLAKSTPQIGAGLKTVDKTGANATNTMMEFSRVVQDAPYGIRGVANNIQQLVGNFGYLSKSAGGAGNAMKAMASSLMGPAGILLAVSLVTSLLVQYGDKLFKSSTEADKLAEKQEKLTKSLEDYEKTLNSVTRAQLDGARNSSDELTTLSLLKSQLDNTNLSNEKRLEAFDELKKKYPTYLSNVTSEDSLIGGLDEKYNDLATAILNKAKAQAAAEIISDNYKKILVLQLKLEQEAEKLGNTAIANNIENNKLKAAGALISASDAEMSQRSQKRYDKALKTAKDTADEIISLQTEAKKLTQYIDAQGGIIPLNFEQPKGDKKGPIRLPATLDIIFNQESYKELEQTFKDAFGRPIPSDQFKLLDNLPISVGETNSQIARLMGELQKVVPSDLFGSLVGLSLQQLQQLENKLQTTQVVADVFNNAVASGFNALGNQIATSLETGNAILDALVSSLINSMASIATALITQAITDKLIAATVLSTNIAKSNANGVTIATSAAAAMGPAGIVALPGLMAGTLASINAVFAGIATAGAFAGGGIANGMVGGGSYNGDKVPIWVNSGEMILNAGQQSNLFDILDGNLRKLGGQQQMQTVNVQGELRGQTILLANKRAEKNTNRFYGRR